MTFLNGKCQRSEMLSFYVTVIKAKECDKSVVHQIQRI